MVRFTALKILKEPDMPSDDFLDALSRKAAELFPQADEVKEDIQMRLNSLLHTSFNKLNLVTREEFDAQVAALRRAESLVEELEQKVAALEAASESPEA